MRRLPFLNGIRAFEAAARAESFAKAAGELNVTPAAVSRMVQLLEQRLGVPLFERKANRLTSPQRPAAPIRAGLTPIFDQLANLTAQVTAMAGSRVLTIGVGPTFATRWLIRGSPTSSKQEPEVEVRFATGGATVPYNDEWTCGVTAGRRRLARICGGAIVRRRSAAGVLARDWRSACARRRICIKSRCCGSRTPPTNGRAGSRRSRWRSRAKGPEFEYYGQALQAAADGVGVAMGISPYVDDDLNAGRLVAPFAQSVSKGEHWYLIYREARRDEAALQAFRAWIVRAASAARPPRTKRAAKRSAGLRRSG